MRKSKIDAYKLAARNDHMGSSEGDVMRQNNLLQPSNATVTDKDKQFFEMRLKTNTTIESLATLTIYNWRSTDATDIIIFPTVSHIWNSIRHINNNDKSFALYRHLI